jgi:type IV secretion system protein VirB1
MTSAIAILSACAVAWNADLLAAIVSAESGGNPLALGLNGSVELIRQPRDRAEAAALARWLLARGHNFDAGLAQVNSANVARLGLDVESVFEPCANLRAASVVLEECHERALVAGYRGDASWDAALSCYNTGHLTRGLANGYVAAVRAEFVRARGRNASRAAVRPNPKRPTDALHSITADAFATSALASR